MQTTERNQVYLACLQDHAPNGSVQTELANMMYLMQTDGLTPKQIEKELVATLYTGLAYGSWPWTDYKKDYNETIKI